MMKPTDDASNDEASHRDSENSKSSMYRAMVARTGSTEWRGNARNKLAAKIEEGTSAAPVRAPSVAEGLLGAPLVDEPLCGETSNPEPPNDAEPEDVKEDSAAEANETRVAADLPEEAEKVDTVAPQAENTPEADLNDESTPRQVDQEENQAEPDKGEESEIPVIYKNWEPKPEDEETDMSDVELGGESEMENRIGECMIDDGAFDRLRAKEQIRRETQRKNRFYNAVLFVMVSALIFLIVWGIVTVSNPSKDTEGDQLATQTDTISKVMHFDSSNSQESGLSAEQVLPFTGHVTPLQEPEVSYGTNNKITLRFPVNMFVPTGSSVVHRVYDGPECSEGAMDITGRTDYVEAGLYSAGPMHRSPMPAERMGLYLQWESDYVQSSPLYTRWAPVDDGSDFDPFVSMDLCIALAIVDSEGLPTHLTETYILTTWTRYNSVKGVHFRPVTTDST